MFMFGLVAYLHPLIVCTIFIILMSIPQLVVKAAVNGFLEFSINQSTNIINANGLKEYNNNNNKKNIAKKLKYAANNTRTNSSRVDCLMCLISTQISAQLKFSFLLKWRTKKKKNTKYLQQKSNAQNLLHKYTQTKTSSILSYYINEENINGVHAAK